jgi:hypothetical protein
VVTAFTDVIDVRNGTTGAEIAPWPFNATERILPFNATQQVTDLLCTEDYTGDHFPDIVAGTENGTAGFLMIINGSNGVLFRGPVQVSSFTLSYIQYMYSYENGMPLLNKTLAVSIEASSGSNYILGVNTSDLTVMKEFPVPNNSAVRNLVNIGNSTNFTGDLLFSAGDAVYYISGTEIVYSEFPLQIMAVILILAVGVSVAILRRERLRID